MKICRNKSRILLGALAVFACAGMAASTYGAFARMSDEFPDINLNNCVIDSYNNSTGSTVGYNENLDITQLKQIYQTDGCSNTGITNLQGIDNLVNLTVADFSQNNINTMSLAFVRSLLRQNGGNLQILNLSNNKSSINPYYLAGFGSLSWLYLNNGSIDDLESLINSLTTNLSNPQLSTLGLNNNKISTIPNNLTKLSNLKSLDLSNNMISDFSPVEDSGISGVEFKLYKQHIYIHVEEQTFALPGLFTQVKTQNYGANNTYKNASGNSVNFTTLEPISVTNGTLNNDGTVTITDLSKLTTVKINGGAADGTLLVVTYDGEIPGGDEPASSFTISGFVGSDFGTVSESITVPAGTSYTVSGNEITFGSAGSLVATPNPSDSNYSYYFRNWIINGNNLEDGYSGTINRNVTFIASFGRKSISGGEDEPVNYIVSGLTLSDYGDVSGPLTVPAGTSYIVSGNEITFEGVGSLVATPKEEDSKNIYYFRSWRIGINDELEDGYSGTINKNTTFIAWFVQEAKPDDEDVPGNPDTGRITNGVASSQFMNEDGNINATNVLLFVSIASIISMLTFRLIKRSQSRKF